MGDKTVQEKVKSGTTSGRRVFGAPKKKVEESSKKVKVDNYYGNSDSEDNLEAKEDIDAGQDGSSIFQKGVNVDPDLLREESEIRHDPVFKVIGLLVSLDSDCFLSPSGV